MFFLSFVLLFDSQPNGRFKVGEKICLSITGYHPEFWQPAWGSECPCVLALALVLSYSNITVLDWD